MAAHQTPTDNPNWWVIDIQLSGQRLVTLTKIKTTHADIRTHLAHCAYIDANMKRALIHSRP